MEGLRSEDLSAENPLEQAHGPAHSEVGVGRGRRPDLSFVRRRQHFEDSDPRLETREGMTSPALPEVHLLRRPGHPAGHQEERSLQTSRITAQICSQSPRPGPAHARVRSGSAWLSCGTMGPGPCRLPGLLGDQAHHPGPDQCRRGWLKDDSPAHSHRLQTGVWQRAATHGPLSHCSGGEMNRVADWGGATSPGSPAAQSGAHSLLCHPPPGASAVLPARYHQRPAAPTSPGGLEPYPVALPGAVPAVRVHTLEGGGSGHGAKGRGKLALKTPRGNWD